MYIRIYPTALSEGDYVSQCRLLPGPREARRQLSVGVEVAESEMGGSCGIYFLSLQPSISPGSVKVKSLRLR